MLRCAPFLRQGGQDDGNNNGVNCKSNGDGKGPAEAGRYEKPEGRLKQIPRCASG
jgi:hypothetical protein